jgi:hypothetical protein
MYKLFLVFVLLTVWVPASFAETITVNTEDGPRTVKIKPNLFGWKQRRVYIQEDNYGNKWEVMEDRDRRYNGKWGSWEIVNEFPIPPYATNMDINEQMRGVMDIVGEGEVHIRVKDLGRSYWWENKVYCNWLYEIYLLE